MPLSSYSAVINYYYPDIPSAVDNCPSHLSSTITGDCSVTTKTSCGGYWCTQARLTERDAPNGSIINYLDMKVPSADNGCPSGLPYTDPNTGQCSSEPPPPQCNFGSLDTDCRVFCPAVDYSYYVNGVKRTGHLAAGYVGHGMNCPPPSYPPNSNDGCVSTDPSCSTDGFDETTTVTTTSDSTTTDGSGGSSSTSTSSTQGPTGSGTSGSGDGSTSQGTGGMDSYGEPVPDGEEGVSDNQVNLGGNDYQLCENGGIVDGAIGCDYNPPQCNANEVPAYGQCIPYVAPQPSDTPPTTTTDTSVTDNGDGTTTTTTTGTSTTGSGQEQQPEDNNSASGGSECDSPPVCDGDAIQCAILQQQWDTRCHSDYEVSGSSDCSTDLSCSGDPIQCAILAQQRQQNCNLTGTITEADLDLDSASATSELAETVDLESTIDIESIFTDPGTSASCPSPTAINLTPGTFYFDYSPFCSVMENLRPFVLFLFSFLSFRILREGV